MTRSMSVPPPLEDDEVRLILVNLDACGFFLEEARGLLSDDEKERAERFKIPGLGDRFTLVRGLLRHYLGGLRGVDAKSLRFAYGSQGKPSLVSTPDATPSFPLHFNLSHSGDLAVFAFSKNRVLGVDVEKLRAIDDRLAERYFSVPESVIFRVTPEDRKDVAFFHFWTSKESFVKALGDGISRGLKDHSFSDPWELPPRLTWVGWDAAEAGRWQFHRFRTDDGDYLGTLAYSGASAKVSEFREL